MASTDARFRIMLTKLAASVNQDELEIMKFRCNDIPKRRQEQITSPLKLWEALEERDLLSADNTHFLRDILSSSTQGRRDLLNILDEYENETYRPTTMSPNPRPDAVQGNVALTKGMRYVAENIGRNWKQLARMLGLEEHEIDEIVDNNSRNFREQCWQCIKKWKIKYQADATNDKLIQALRECRMNLTADNVEQLT